MSFTVNQRPQTGALNPDLIAQPSRAMAAKDSASSLKSQPDDAGQAPQEALGQNLSLASTAARMRSLVASNQAPQPVSVEFPSGQAGSARATMDAVLAETNVSKVSALYEILTAKADRPESLSQADKALLKAFDLGVGKQGLISLKSGQALSTADLAALQHAARMRVSFQSNQAIAVNQKLSNELGLRAGTMLELMRAYENPDRQTLGMAMMLESTPKVMTGNLAETDKLRGVSGFLANAAQATDGFNTALIRILRGQDIGQLDLEKDANFIFAQLLTENDINRLKSAETAMKAGARPEGIASLSEQDVTLLRQFGIHVDKAHHQLLNLITGEVLSAGHLQAIQQATAIRASMLDNSSFVPGLDLDPASKHAAVKLKMAVGNLAELNTIRHSLDQRALEIDKLTKRVRVSHDSIRNDDARIDQLQTQIGARIQARSGLSQIVGTMAGGSFQTFVKDQALKGKLGHVNGHLAGSGLSVAVGPLGQVSYSYKNRPISAAEFQGSVTAYLSQIDSDLKQDQTDLEQAQSQKQLHIEESRLATEELQSATKAQSDELERYKREADLLKQSSLPDLRALKADPAFWNKQPESVRRMIDDLIAQGEQALSQVDETVSRHQRIIRDAEKVVAESRRFIALAIASSKATDRLLEQIDTLLESAAKGQPSAAAKQELAELIAEADRMMAEFSLAPQPGPTDAEALAKETRILLEKLSAVYRAGQKDQATRQSFQDRIQQAYLEKTLESLRYHFDKLTMLARPKQA